MQAVPTCDEPGLPDDGTGNPSSERTSVRKQTFQDLAVTPRDGIAL